MTSSKPRILLAAVALAGGLLSLGTTTVGAAPTTPAAPAVESHVVTLVTGDRVRATKDSAGTWSVAVLGGRDDSYQEFTRRNGTYLDHYLVPESAAKLVDAGQLDLELFDVTSLIRQGYDDAHTDVVPLLVQGPAGIAASRVQRELPGFTAIDESKRDSAVFWRDLAGDRRRSLASTKVWLNARLKPSLDVSVPQVGAPAAWQAGYTGKGVTVAVLDSGIDATHPDLAGKVVQDKDFTGTGNTVDDIGHGTHVASIITGTGAASGGKYKGVAPDVKLAVGKVTAGRFGQMDDIIAGMQWASTEVRAKVVNMSLGSGPTDGTDPVSQTLNTLTRQNGTLFVVAAGNEGADGTVAAPAAADEALAVGNVTKSDQLAPTSSRGPRVIDGAVKPEIAAPGEDIVAALASGVEPLGEVVDGRYVRLSGTSMAAPHVAGGAAILASEHPDWTAAQLKAGLVGTAAPVAGNVFAVGSGRLDLAHATTETVQASPATVNGYLSWGGDSSLRRTVTYRSATAVTLTLKLDVPGATLSTSTVTIPAGGQADVTVTMTRGATPGQYSGVLTASTPDGVSHVRTPVSAYVEPEMYDLTVNLLDRNGSGAAGRSVATVVSMDDEHVHGWRVPNGGRLRLPVGRYFIDGTVYTEQAGGGTSVTSISYPELNLTTGREVTLDARTAHRVSVHTDQPDIRDGTWYSVVGTVRDPKTNEGFRDNYVLNPRFSEFYAGSVPGVSSPSFLYADTYKLTTSTLELSTGSTDVKSRWLTNPMPEGTRQLPLAYGLSGDVKGKLVVLEPDDLAQQVAQVKDAGGMAVAVRDSVSSFGGGGELVLPTLAVGGVGADRLVDAAKAGGTATLTVRAPGKDDYELAFGTLGQVPTDLAHTVRKADLVPVTMAFYGYSADNPPLQDAGPRLGTIRLTGIVDPIVKKPNQEQVEHYTPGNWNIAVYEGAAVLYRSKAMVMEAGHSYRVAWNQAALGPAFPGGQWVVRNGNQIDVRIPVFTDAAGNPMVANDQEGDVGTTSLYRDGKLVATQNLPGQGTFQVPPASAGYRLVTDVTRNQPWWPLATKVTAEWTFTDCAAVLPLLSVQYKPAVNLANTAPGGVDFTIPVTVTRQDGPARIRSLKVDVSYDDGVTWTSAKVTKDNTVSVHHPATGYASLRVHAADTDGNTTSQTVIRAYRIGS